MSLICPRCNGTGESSLCESCVCVYCCGSGELEEDGKPKRQKQRLINRRDIEEQEDERDI
jgi:RecJ-like exonuclease